MLFRKRLLLIELGNKERTFTSFGGDAQWNETIKIGFIPPENKFTPVSLQSIQDDITINIYDELVVNKKANDNRIKDTRISRIEKRYLGTLIIPFTTIYFNKFIEGNFDIEFPLIQFGYQRRFNQSSFIQLFATIDPIINPINVPISNIDDYCIQLSINNDKNAHFYEYCHRWATNIEQIVASDNSNR